MSLPSHANVVIIGAGIVGNCVAYHLGRLGWRDLVMIDKGPLPNPGGSTGHASNFIFPVDHSKLMTRLTQDSMKQYKALGVFRESGGLELARTAENLTELQRRVASATCWDEEGAVIGVDDVIQRMPFVNPSLIKGAFWSPRVGVVDSLRAGTLMREAAERMQTLKVIANTEILDLVVRCGRVREVRTTRGSIQADYVVIACGVWSPRLGRMAGASIPLTPAVHQMISVGPIRQFAEKGGEIDYPIIRDMSTRMYERQNGSDMEIGSYAHRPILHDPADIPSIQDSKLSPTELPFTKEDFELQMKQALELLPELLDDGSVGIKHAINGLLSLTPDGAPVIGETPEVKGLWSAAAVWIKEGPGVGRLVAEWMVSGAPELDPNEVDIARFHQSGRSRAHVCARSAEGFNKIYAVVHPQEQWQTSRQVRLSPFYGREEQLGAMFFETAGWERPYWYEANRPLLAEYRDRIQDRPNEWDARWWSPIIDAEHLAMRERVGMVDLSAFAIFDAVGPGALDFIQRLTVGQMDVTPGKAVYTPLLDARGGLKSDLTITRMREDAFRIVTGGSQAGIDGKWLRDNLPADRSVCLHDQTSSLFTLGVWGPNARRLLQSVTREDLSNTAFPYGTARDIWIGPVSVWALRISYVGELGWELYAPMETGRQLWDLIWEAGQAHGLVPVGIGVYGTTARLEKGYRLYGHELEPEFDPVEAGLVRPKVKPQDFVGKAAYLRAREQPPAAVLCTLTVDDHTSRSGERRYIVGHAPVLTPAGKPLDDAKGRRSYVTSAGSAPSLGKQLLMAYLPAEHAVEGARLAVEYFGEQYPVTVARSGSVPLFDPGNERMRA